MCDLTLRDLDINSVPVLASSVFLFSEGFFSLIQTLQTLMSLYDSLKQQAHESIY